MYGLAADNFQGATFLAVAIMAAACACVYLVWFVLALWGHEQDGRARQSGKRTMPMEDGASGVDWYDEAGE